MPEVKLYLSNGTEVVKEATGTHEEIRSHFLGVGKNHITSVTDANGENVFRIDKIEILDATERSYRNVRCMVAGHSVLGPEFNAITVECTQEQYNLGKHYEAARDWAMGESIGNPITIFDQYDGPAWLFDHFEECESYKDIRTSILPD